MTQPYEEGGFSAHSGRPLGSIFVPPAYGISFINKTVHAELSPTGLNSANTLFQYEEDLSSTKGNFVRVLHFNLTNPSTGKIIDGPFYVPFIQDMTFESGITKVKLHPLTEVVNPTFHPISENEFIMYYFSNFNIDVSTGSSVSSDFDDSPVSLRKLAEFASNDVFVFNPSSSSSFVSEPHPNNRNLYAYKYPEDNEPRIALMSCLLRVSTFIIDGIEKIYVMSEKPRIVTYIGKRFGLDFQPPLLVNTTQKIKWAEDKEASQIGSGYLDEDAVYSSIPRQIPYDHLISGIEAIMYPGYAGVNFKTRPIHEIYDITLDHVFRVDGVYSKTFNIDDPNSSFIRGIKVSQQDLESISFDEYDCFGINGSSSRSSHQSASGLAPFNRHVVVFDIITEGDFSPSSSSSSSSLVVDEYVVQIPASMDPKGDDKPDFWPTYWDDCGGSSGGGDININRLSEYVWRGEGCIDEVGMFIELEYTPFGYYQEEIYKWILTIGLTLDGGGDFDIIWKGYKIDGISPVGDFDRMYAVGDNTPDTITITES